MLDSTQPTTLDPQLMSTPPLSPSCSFSRDSSFMGSPTPEFASENPKDDHPKPEESSDKPPPKKRRSWGQVLPKPTTNLPPRKRAKTAEEKEQRRVERVLRNRAAAQKSREVKKQQLEVIEKQRDALAKQAEEQQNTLDQLMRERASFTAALQNALHEIAQLKGSATPMTPHEYIEKTQSVDSPFIKTEQFSPNPEPPLDVDALLPIIQANQSITMNSSTSVTQHPAALLCFDLPCPWLVVSFLVAIFAFFLLAPASGMISSRMAFTIGLTISTPSLLATLLWLLRPTSPRTFLPSLSTMTSVAALTLNLGKIILTCNSSLARPRTATQKTLRLGSNAHVRVQRSFQSSNVAEVGDDFCLGLILRSNPLFEEATTGRHNICGGSRFYLSLPAFMDRRSWLGTVFSHKGGLLNVLGHGGIYGLVNK